MFLVRTHVISAILNIKQKVDSDWPLQIYDHAGHLHEVTLKEGEMVWYESAKMVHARAKPLNGSERQKYFRFLQTYFRLLLREHLCSLHAPLSVLVQERFLHPLRGGRQSHHPPVPPAGRPGDEGGEAGAEGAAEQAETEGRAGGLNLSYWPETHVVNLAV